MSKGSENIIEGSEFNYIIDNSYGFNKDGYIATGTESIVFKGIKISKDKKIQLSCVLKFKYKSIIVGENEDGERTINVLERFKNSDLKIFNDLQDCRSVVRIFDIIEDLGDFILLDKHVGGEESVLTINREQFFCVVEEYIDGWSLEEYCRDEYWKLTETRELQYGIKTRIGFHEYAEDVKNSMIQSYNTKYDSIIRYQNEMYGYMINLCEIMEYVTDKHRILHLDLKPDNIMVTRHGKELVLIDFGRSEYMNDEDYVDMPLAGADYNADERIERMYQYGTLGYASPEAYVAPINNSEFPFSNEGLNCGKLTVESDIFSFGATFWECLNVFELYTKSKEFAKDKNEGGSYDFYKKNMLNDGAYFNRDLSLTSRHYHIEMERIIRKCTRNREDGYLDRNHPNYNRYYHNYSELKEDIIFARDSSPAIVKTEEIKVSKTFGALGGIIGTCFNLLIVWVLLLAFSSYFSSKKWDNMIATYNGMQIDRFKTVTDDYMKVSPDTKKQTIYEETANFLYNDDSLIDYSEAKALVVLLENINDQSSLTRYIDDILTRADERRYGDIFAEIVKLQPDNPSEGYIMAEAVYNIERVTNSQKNTESIISGYEILKRNEKNQKFKSIVIRLKNTLNHDDKIKQIVNDKEDYDSIFEYLNSIK